LDPALIVRAQAGDVDAFTTIVTERAERMSRLAMAIVGHEADARDATQEALASVWRELPRLRDPERFDAWSTRILVHACRRTLRARGRARVREVSLPAADDPDRRPFEDSRRSADMVTAVGERQALERAFNRLDPDARTILVLHHLDGQAVADIAAMLGIPVGTAKSRLHTARTALERALNRENR
jgi:RNA polymerase sigma-70 factor (ECF subfamily)